MDAPTAVILVIGLLAFAIWVPIMLNWRAGVYLLVYYTPFMGLVIVLMSNLGMGSLALVSRDVLFVAPLYL